MNSLRAKPEGGFTLIEVLVALTILSVSLLALLSVFGNGFHRARHVRDSSLATSLAQSLLAVTAREASLRVGDTAGQFADGFRWHVRVAPYGEGQGAEDWPVRALRVSVEVSWADGRFERSIALDTLRLAPKETR